MADTSTQLRIFISHNRQDNDFCRVIVKALRDAGADVYYDEHNLNWGELHDEIQRELGRRPIFIPMLSKTAFGSKWVKREAIWAYKLYERDPTRVILPITVAPIDAADFDPEAGWLFLDDFKRIEVPGLKPYPMDEAARRLLRAISLTSATLQATETADDLITRGRALNAQGKHTEALPLLQRAMQIAPSSSNAWFNLGYTLSQLGHYDEALSANEHALTLAPHSAFAWYNKGVVLAALGRVQEALAAFDRAVALNPAHGEAWHNKGVMLGHMGRSQEALAAFDQSLALDSSYAPAWYNKGVTLANIKRYKDALVAFDRALALTPNYREALGNKAFVLRALGRTAEAAQVERRAKSLGG